MIKLSQHDNREKNVASNYGYITKAPWMVRQAAMLKWYVFENILFKLDRRKAVGKKETTIV
jgi:hypothetical protein